MTSRIIDTKMPLTWLLSTAAAIIMAMTLIAINFNRQSDSLNAKMDALLASNAEMKVQNEKRDVKSDSARDTLYTLQRSVDALDLRVGNIERNAPRGR